MSPQLWFHSFTLESPILLFRTIRTSAHARRLAKASLSELPILFSDWLDLSQADNSAKRNRVFTPTRTFWLFLAQILSADGSCTEAVRRALAWLATDEGEPSPESSAYCQARMRLPEELLDTLARQVVERV